MLELILVITLSYLTGAIPFSILAGKITKGIDIRDHGSGNAGTTNVFRVLGWQSGIAVGLLDLSKGLIPVMFISELAIDSTGISYSLIQIISGMAAVSGHIWTIFAGFKGGKGALTAVGVFIALAPLEIAITFTVFGLVFLFTKYVSLATLTATLTLLIIMTAEKYFLDINVDMPLFVFVIIIVTLIFATHKSNIIRLINGTENKFSRQ